MIDFTKKKPRTMDIILHDGEKIYIPVPTKKLLDKLMALSSDVDELYDIVCLIINSNKKKIYAKSTIEEMFSIDDLNEFVTAYMDFIKNITNDPN